MDVGDLQARLTIEISNFLANMERGSEESKQLVRDLVAVGAEGDRLREGFASGVAEGITAEFNDMQKAAASVGNAMRSIGQGLGEVDKSGRRSVVAIASVTSNLTAMANAGDLSAAGIARTALGLAQLVTQSGIAGRNLVALVNGLLAIGAAGAGAAVVGELIAGGFKKIGDGLEAIGNRKAALADVSGLIKELNSQLDKVTTDTATARIKTFGDETEAIIQKVRDTGIAIDEFGNAHKVAQGQIDATIATIRRERDELAVLKAAAESVDVGKKLSEDIRKGAEDAIAEIDKLKAEIGTTLGTPTNAKTGVIHADAEEAELAKLRAGIALTATGALDLTARLKEAEAGVGAVAGSAEANFAVLKKLGEEIDFKGPLTSLLALQKTLDDTAKKIAEIGKGKLDPAAIAKSIGEAQVKIKAAFQEDLKLKLQIDPTAADAEIKSFLESINALPAAELKAGFNIAQVLGELSVLRSKIADTPDGELKIRLQAEASALEAKIKEERARVEKTAVMPVDADTTEAQKKIDALRKQAEEADKALKEREAGSGIGAGGPTLGGVAKVGGLIASALPAGPEEIINAVNQLVDRLKQAIASGDTAGAASLRAAGKAFVEQFLPSLKQLQVFSEQSLSNTTNLFNTAVRDEVAAVQGLQGVVQGFTLALGGSRIGSQPDLLSRVDETNRLVREQIDISKQAVAATGKVADGISSGRFAQGVLLSASRLASEGAGNVALKVGR